MKNLGRAHGSQARITYMYIYPCLCVCARCPGDLADLGPNPPPRTGPEGAILSPEREC